MKKNLGGKEKFERRKSLRKERKNVNRV